MRKHLMKIRHWGVRVSLICLFLFISLAIMAIAITPTHASFAVPLDTPPAATPTTAPVVTPTTAPVVTPTAAPQPTAQPQPTTAPNPVPTTPVGVTQPPPQQNNPVPGTGSNQAPVPGPGSPAQPTPTFAISGTPGDMSVNNPAQAQDTNTPLDPVFSPLGVSVMLVSILGVAGVVLLLMRNKQSAPFAQTAQGAGLAQTGRPATTPVSAASQRDMMLSSAQSGRISLDPHGALTEFHDAVSSPQAPKSDFSPLPPLPHTELPNPMSPVSNKGNISQPLRAAAMPSIPPETPSLLNGESSGNAEPVSTGQLMAIMRQAQEGLFVIPEREQEKQTR